LQPPHPGGFRFFVCQSSLFQNPVGFEPGSWKNRQKPGFSTKFKEAVPKTEVFEQPQFYQKVYFSNSALEFCGSEAYAVCK
jgi:hypothetical protein